MKKRTLAALLLILALLLTSSCGKAPAGNTETEATVKSKETLSAGTSDAGTPSAPNVEQTLMEAFEKDGYPLKQSPVRSYLDYDEDGVYYDYTSLDDDLDGAYALKFTDTDADGQNELLVFRLVNEDPYVLEDDTRLTRYFLYVTGYDLNDDGKVVSDFYATGLNTGAIFELEGLSRCYAGEKDGTITILDSFEYMDSDYYYALCTFKNGVFTKEYERSLLLSREPGEEDEPAYVSGGIWDRNAGDFTEETKFEGFVGSPDVESSIASIKDEIAKAGMSDFMFPLQDSGEKKSGDVFDDRCDIKFGPVYDYDTERLCLFVEGKIEE